MSAALIWSAAVLALASAARSTWSPCGLSMLSSITPFGERARRHRYAATAAWFIVGGLVGGVCLGAMASTGAWIERTVVGRPGPAALSAAAGLALGGALVDGGVFGDVLPVLRRQVDDRWMSRYRPWVYGFGFGWQIGVGVTTYVMTAGIAVLVGLAVLTGSPVAALGLGALFGLARGATVLLTARASTPAGLKALHQRLDRIGGSVKMAVTGVQAGGAAGLAVAAGLAPTGGGAQHVVALAVAMAAVAGGALGWATGALRSRPAGRPAGATASGPPPADGPLGVPL